MCYNVYDSRCEPKRKRVSRGHSGTAVPCLRKGIVMPFFAWWESLSLTTQIFTCVAIPATLVLIIQTVMLFFGFGEADTDADVPDGLDADADGVFGEDAPDGDVLDGTELLRLFSLRGIVAFAAVFGWVGSAMSASGVTLALTIPVAIVCGFAMMVALALLMRAIFRLRSDGSIDNRNAIGASAKVYLTVPGSRSGEGKVHLLLQGSLVERGAVTDEESPIPTGAEVVVVGVGSDTALVVKSKDESAS